jgi:hypothetical protein
MKDPAAARTRKIVRRVLESTNRLLAEAEELKRAKAALDRLATEPPLQVTGEEDEAQPEGDRRA